MSSPAIRIEHLAARMAQRIAEPVGDLPSDGQRRAAVAIVLHDGPDGVSVLLMKRATRASDPWSGHISLPGGGFHPEDRDLATTAIRETREELGVELTATRPLGKLEPLHPLMSGPQGVEVTPFIFVTTEALEPVLGPEADSAFWLPLGLAASGTLDGTVYYQVRAMSFPCWNYEGHVIWGLTWRVLGELLVLAAAPSSR